MISNKTLFFFSFLYFQGLFGSCLNNTVHTWALRLKGPVFVAMFKPLSIVVAIVMGVLFLGDSLYLGRYDNKQRESSGISFPFCNSKTSSFLHEFFYHLN